MNSLPTGISVVLCCYNSAKRLPETLKYIFRQRVPAGLSWEVIVIDNNSTDDTRTVAETCYLQYGNAIAFRVVSQPAPGLSMARDKGVESATYSYILFCDDDNWLDPDYVAKGFSYMDADKNIGVVGGLAVAAPEPPEPAWFRQRISHYAVGDQAKFAADGWVYGAGSVCRREVLLQLKAIGWIQVTSDRLGDVYLYGGDNEICYMFRLLGYSIMYNPQITFRHYIPQERLQEGYIWKSAYGSYLSGFFLYPYFFFLSKRFKSKTATGFLFFFTIYFGKTFLLAIFRAFFSRNELYTRKMARLELKASYRFLPHVRKVFRQYALLKKILNR